MWRLKESIKKEKLYFKFFYFGTCSLTYEFGKISGAWIDRGRDKRTFKWTLKWHKLSDLHFSHKKLYGLNKYRSYMHRSGTAFGLLNSLLDRFARATTSGPDLDQFVGLLSVWSDLTWVTEGEGERVPAGLGGTVWGCERERERRGEEWWRRGREAAA